MFQCSRFLRLDISTEQSNAGQFEKQQNVCCANQQVSDLVCTRPRWIYALALSVTMILCDVNKCLGPVVIFAVSWTRLQTAPPGHFCFKQSDAVQTRFTTHTTTMGHGPKRLYVGVQLSECGFEVSLFLVCNIFSILCHWSMCARTVIVSIPSLKLPLDCLDSYVKVRTAAQTPQPLKSVKPNQLVPLAPARGMECGERNHNKRSQQTAVKTSRKNCC